MQVRLRHRLPQRCGQDTAWLHLPPPPIFRRAAPQDKTSTGSNLKIQALQFLNLALAANDPAVFQARREQRRHSRIQTYIAAPALLAV